MSVSINRTEEEWICADGGRITVCALVRDGQLQYGKLIGVKNDPIQINSDRIGRLGDLRNALTELLEAISGAQERTRPPTKAEG